MAMQANGGEKVVLTDIYQWIRDSFAYFRGSDNSWQNSIRHNLSLNKQFIKVPRDPEDKGKGSYWMLDPKSYRKDPYCIRRRNFFDSHSRRPKPAVDKPQVNPAIRNYLERARQQQETLRHPFAGIGERLEDIGAQECVYTDTNPGYDDFNQKLFKREVETYAGYVPQNDLVINLPTNNSLSAIDAGQRVKVEYNWEAYEYHPSNVLGPQLPLQLSPGGALLQPPTSSVSLSPPNRDEAEAPQGLDLRIPTPEWWNHQVTTASLLSPMAISYSAHHPQATLNPMAKVFENFGSAHSNTGNLIPLTKVIEPHPWNEDAGNGALMDLDHPMVPRETPAVPHLPTRPPSHEDSIVTVDV